MTPRDAAGELLAGGWHPLPLPAGQKSPPPTGTTGRGGTNYTAADIASADWSGNIAVRAPADVIGIDIDVYKGGDKTLSDLLEQCGPLPPTWVVHNGRNDGSGIRWYRAPQMRWIPGLPGFDIIQHNHRFGVVPPSVHPEGRPYEVYDQQGDEPVDQLPPVEDLPELPWTWVAVLARATDDAGDTTRPSDATTVQQFVRAYNQADEPSYLAVITNEFNDHVAAGYSRHDTAQHVLIWAMECAAAGVLSANTALRALGQLWQAALSRPGDNPRRAQLAAADRVTEYDAMLRYAVAKALAKPEHQLRKIHDDIAGVRINPPPTEPAAEAEPAADLAQDGATFILDEPADLVARWGTGNDVLWSTGESVLICGPAGVGKTTLAGQLLAGLAGIQPAVLGYPVKPATRVLYLAMDRPRQIRRAFKRLFTEHDRALLAEHVVIRPGPLPVDLGTDPTALIRYANHYHADVVILDSLKDAATKLSDDGVAGNVNRAIQLCNAAGIDVAALHHQRKSGDDGKRPNTLADVYGSTWLTAGAGSVLLVWGEPGSETVEIVHLKQPAEIVGPLTVEHDHHAGRSTVVGEWNALAYLTHRGATGATLADATRAQHGGEQKPGTAKWKQTQRRMQRLVREGFATQTDQTMVGDSVRYTAIVHDVDA